MWMPRNAGKCKIRPAPHDLAILSSSIYPTQHSRCLKQGTPQIPALTGSSASQSSGSSHRTPTSIVSQFRQEQFPVRGNKLCTHEQTSKSGRQCWVTVPYPHKFLCLPFWGHRLTQVIIAGDGQ